MTTLENAAPKIFRKAAARDVTTAELDPSVVDKFDDREIFDLIRDINDPEHPLTLEELNVVEESLCRVKIYSIWRIIRIRVRLKVIQLIPNDFN